MFKFVGGVVIMSLAMVKAYEIAKHYYEMKNASGNASDEAVS